MEFKGGLKGNCRFLNCRGFWKEFKRGVKSNWKGFKWRLKGVLKAMVGLLSGIQRGSIRKL